MAGRGHIPAGFDGRQVQASGYIRHGQLERLAPTELLESKIAIQAAEIERLIGDNRRLATTHVVLKQDLSDAQQEVERLKAQIRSTQTESDIQMRILSDKIAKMESEIRIGENVKKELSQAHLEAQSLVKAGQELTIQIRQASQDLEKVRAEGRSLPDLQAELNNLRHEYNSVRATFEHEKGLNIEKVGRLKAKEQKLIGMAREAEKLYADLLNAEKLSHAPNPYASGHVSPDRTYQQALQIGATLINTYGTNLNHEH